MKEIEMKDRRVKIDNKSIRKGKERKESVRETNT